MLFITLKKVFKNVIIILPRIDSVISEANSMVKKRLKKEERKKIIQDISKNVFFSTFLVSPQPSNTYIFAQR